MSRIRDILDWDEAKDPAAGPPKPPKPWNKLNHRDRQLLDALADSEWVPETSLRLFLDWSRVRFFLVTLRMVSLGWIKARPLTSPFSSEYRLNPSAWN